MANVLETFKSAVGELFSGEPNDPLDKKKGKPKKKGVQEIATPGRMTGRVSREVKSDKPLEDNVPTLDISAEQSPTLAEKFGTTQVELPKNASEEPKPATLSKKAMSKAKTVSPEKSEGLSNTFAQAIGGVIPMLIGTALGGVEGGVATGQNVIAAKAAEDSVRLKERELDIKENAADAQLRADRITANSKLVDAKIKNQKDFSERFVGSKSFGNFTALGGKEEAAKLRGMVTETENIASGLDKLLNLTENITAMDMDRRAIVEQEISKLVGKLRIPITGPGAFTDSEREFIKDIVGDPSTIFSLESTERLKLQNLLNSSKQEMRTRLQNNTVEGAAELKAYQSLKSRGYTDEQIEEVLSKRK